MKENEVQPSVDNKKHIEEILGKLRENTFLSLKKNVVCEKTKSSCSITTDELSRKILCGQIAQSDVFILQAVNKFTFATVEMVSVEIGIVKKDNPEKIVPDVGESAIKNRLNALAMCGLVIGQRINFESGDSLVVYCCTDHAYQYMRHVLLSRVYGDSYIAAFSKYEMLKRVSCAYITMCLAKKWKNCKVHGIGNDYSLGKDNIQYYSYGKVEDGDEKENKKVVLIEPLYFYVDTSIQTESEAVSLMTTKLKSIRKWIQTAKSQKKITVKIAFVIEDLKGLQKAIHLVHSTVPEIESMSYYTSESIVHEMKNSIFDAFIYAEYDDQKLQVFQKNILEDL